MTQLPSARRAEADRLARLYYDVLTTEIENTDPDPVSLVDWGRLPSTIVYSALANILTLQQLTGLAIPF
ncbi:hypothetical protein, partial [Mycobacterium sp. 050134]|uniref:hypothetical protein n=1 Tax=Mycobacterium sp. 050134 TaxID=3096111 RepID=UPI002EDA861C